MKPTREQLEEQNQWLRQVVADLHWMARRYADGRHTHIPATFNRYTRELLRMRVRLNPTMDRIIFARDGMGRRYDGLTEAEATPGTPEAQGKKP